MRGAAAGGPLLERSAELARIESALAEARDGTGRFVVVEGPAGIGKTELLAAARTCGGRRRDARAPVAGDRAGARFRLRSGASALRAAARRGVGARARRSAAGRRRGGGRLPRTSGRTPLLRPACFGRRSFVRDPARALLVVRESGCGNGPLCVVVDDAHWADAPSLRYLAFLLTRLQELNVALLVATRPREAGTDAELARDGDDRSFRGGDPAPSADENRGRSARGVEARRGSGSRSSSTPACGRHAERRSWCVSSWTR